MPTDLLDAQAQAVKAAARVVAIADDVTRRGAVVSAAVMLRERVATLLRANAEDVAQFDGGASGLDRLRLDEDRIRHMADAMDDVADLADPVGELVNASVRPNGLCVAQMRVPLGVVGVIYENRPNVTTDVAALCLRSGNAAFLRGSASAQRTNLALRDVWHDALTHVGLPTAAVTLVEDTSRDAARRFMGLVGVIDCLIPRGGPELIAAMREHARVPYVIDGDGNCHVYVDRTADLDVALRIVHNAKLSRPGVCNAAESLLVHRDVAVHFLPRVAESLAQVELRGDARTRAIVPSATVATDEDFATEFLGPVLAVAVVDSLDDAMNHVARFGSGHSEAIVTQDEAAAQRWVREVDAAAVVVNASTRFVDGGELGLGAEVGISTQKLHARGPMGLRELTCLKWVLQGKGQIR
jgi:glutamate-5-semialdehyde dehydrogenase